MMHNTRQFLEAVRLIQARGVTRGQAWNIVAGIMPRVYDQIAIENSLPAGAQLSDDGKVLVADWPVSPDVLRKLGLPDTAAKREYELYRRAAAVKIDPEIYGLAIKP